MSKHWDPRESGQPAQWDRYRGTVQAHRKPRRRLRNWQLSVLMLLPVYAGLALYGAAGSLPSGAEARSRPRRRYG